MIICRVARGFLPRHDGLSVHAASLSAHQAAAGHRVFALQPHALSSVHGGLVVVRLHLGPFARRLNWKLSILLIGLTALPRVAALQRRHRLDVLHIHGDVIEAAVLAPWARWRGIVVILTLHGGLNPSLRYRRFARWALRFVDGIIGTSMLVRDQLLEFGLTGRPIAVISSGVDLQEFRPPTSEERAEARRALGIGPLESVVLTVGRLHPVKGYGALVRAARRAPGQGGPVVILVGDGPEADALQRMAAGLPHVRFAGEIPHHRVRQYLHAADVFVLPSVSLPGSMEGTPTALLEAMACGLPVVCTMSGGLKYLVQDGVHGFLAPENDPDKLWQAISSLLASAELRQHMGRRNREVAAERDWRQVAERVTEFYRQVSGAQSGRCR